MGWGVIIVKHNSKFLASDQPPAGMAWSRERSQAKRFKDKRTAVAALGEVYNVVIKDHSGLWKVFVRDCEFEEVK